MAMRQQQAAPTRQVSSSSSASATHPPADRGGLSGWLHAAGGARLHYALLALDAAMCVAIVSFVAYTEIDWVAYMQEVEGYLAGERDYRLLRGDTGPLVYPAGFVYLFAFLHWITNEGSNILLAQWLWAGLYLATTALVMALYRRAGAPPLLSVALILSKRIHSIFMLRMFNDCVAMGLAYAAFYVMVHAIRSSSSTRLISFRWTLASVLYSLGVSIKMNLFLFAPGIFFVWMTVLGPYRTGFHIAVCALVQVALGWPFLTTYPEAYVSKAFELSRVFTYKWTVNLKFLPEEIFVDKRVGFVLLALTLAGWLVTWRRRWVSRTPVSMRERPAEMLATFFEANLIGIAFSRTLHYQFYVWFFHQLPFVLGFSCASSLPGVVRLGMLVVVEVAFNVFPATWWSSLALTVVLWAVAAAIAFGFDKPGQWATVAVMSAKKVAGVRSPPPPSTTSTSAVAGRRRE